MSQIEDASDNDTDNEKSVVLIEEKRTKSPFHAVRDRGVGKQRERTRHVDPARNNTVGAVEVRR